MIEAVAFATSAEKENDTLVSVKETLGITDESAAKKGLRELIATVARKAYPSIDRLGDVRRMMGKARPSVLSLNIPDLLADGPLRALDVSGYIDQTFSAYGSE